MKFERPNSNIVPFGTNANENKRFAFGTNNYTNDINENLNDSFKLGWETVGINSKPPRQWFNGLAYTSTYLTSYLFQAGIPEWNDKQKYYINSIVMGSDGNLYKSLTGTEETPNTNNNPTLAGSVSWKSILSDYALINGDETKRFKVADAEEDDEAVNLKQLNEASMNINNLPDKPAPDDTDNLVLQETGGLLKKLSFENLTKLSPNDERVKTALNATGNAPIYACRAWVNFNGTGTAAIRASGNVSSITDKGVGSYTINFTTAMTDSNYSIVTTCKRENTNSLSNSNYNIGMPNTYTTTSVNLICGDIAGNVLDLLLNNVSIFR